MTITRENYEMYFIDYIDGKLAPHLDSEFHIFLEQNDDLRQELNDLENVKLDSVKEEFTFKNDIKKSPLKISNEELNILLAKELEGDLTSEENKILSELAKTFPAIENMRKFFAKSKLTPSKEIFEAKNDSIIPESLNLSAVENLMVAKIEGDLTHSQNEELSQLLSANEALRAQLRLFYKTKLTAEATEFEFKDILRKKETPVLPLKRIFIYTSSVAAIAIFMLWFGLGEKTVASELASVSDRNADITILENKSPTLSADNSAAATSAMINPVTLKSHSIANATEQKRIGLNDETAVALHDNSHRIKSNEVNLMEMKMPIDEIAYQPQSGIKSTTVDMMLVHQVAPSQNSTANNNTSEPSTIWQLMGNEVENRIEKTAAYALLERQTEKIKPTTDRFFYERTNQDLKLKVGTFEFKKEMSRKKSNNSSTLLQRIAEKIERLKN